MKRSSLLVFITLFAVAAPLRAQNRPAAQNAEKELPGRWEGTFHSDHGGGNIQLQVESGKNWKAVMSMQTDLHPIPDQELSAFQVHGNKLSWQQELMGGACTSAAVLEKGELQGETRCDHVRFTFSLRKKQAP